MRGSALRSSVLATPTDEIIIRLEIGTKLNTLEQQIYQENIDKGKENKEAREIARETVWKTAEQLFRKFFPELKHGNIEEKLYSNIYNWKMVASRLNHYEPTIVATLNWGVLQALSSPKLPENLRGKLLALFHHSLEHPDCPNSLPMRSQTSRDYCQHLDEEKMREVEIKYLLLLEEKNILLTPEQIVAIQAIRDRETSSMFGKVYVNQIPITNSATLYERDIPREYINLAELQEPIVQEAPKQEPIKEKEPIVQEAAKQEPIVQHFTDYSSLITSFNAIIKAKDEIIQALQDQVVVLSDMAKGKEQSEKDYTVLYEEWEKSQAAYEKIQKEMEAEIQRRVSVYVENVRNKVIGILDGVILTDNSL